MSKWINESHWFQIIYDISVYVLTSDVMGNMCFMITTWVFSFLDYCVILVKCYQFCWFNSASSVLFKWEIWIIYVLSYTQRVICSINISNWMKVYSFTKCSSITLSPRGRRKWQPRKQGLCCKNNSYFSSKAFWTSGIWTWQYWKWCIHSAFESLSIYDKTKVDEVKSEGKTKQIPLK